MTNKPISDKASETDESSKVIGPRGNWTARISLFVATIALGAAIFLGYQLIYLQPIERQAEQTQAALSSFEQQILQPGEEMEMPMRFIVGHELPKNIRSINLSYALFDVTDSVTVAQTDSALTVPAAGG